LFTAFVNRIQSSIAHIRFDKEKAPVWDNPLFWELVSTKRRSTLSGKDELNNDW